MIHAGNHLAASNTATTTPPQPLGTAQGVASSPRVSSAREPRGYPGIVWYIYALWAIVLTDVHRWIGSDQGLNIPAVYPMLAVAVMPLIVLLFIRVPALVGKKDIWILPLLAFVLITMVTVPRAVDSQVAWGYVKILATFYILGVASLVFLNTPRRVVPVCFMAVGQYLWWGWHSGRTGAVWWHPMLSNYDGYGPLVLIGISLCFFFALATKSKFYRAIAFFLAAFCVLAVVASGARGVFLSAVLMSALMWLRSPNKGTMTIAMAVGIATLVVTSFTLSSAKGVFWADMKSSFTEGKTEGTGLDRWEMWTFAFSVFQERPLLGVGAEQTGIYAYKAAQDLQIEVSGTYGEWFGLMSGRALHSLYMQVLAEFGILGSMAFIWIVVDFWRRNARLRRWDYRKRWAQLNAGRLDLRFLAIGLEGAMVAFLATAFFYNQLWNNWMYTIVILNLLLYMNAIPAKVLRRQHVRTSSGAALRTT